MQNIRAILLLILAMAAFTIEDSFIKLLSASLPLGQILTLLGTGGAIVFAAIAWTQGHKLSTTAAWRALPLWRLVAEAVSVLTYVTALALIDISTVAAVFQTVPLVITMGAALFLGEAVGWRRWSAIAVGFIGVLIIIRPGLDGFQPMILIVLITVISIAARDLITRRLSDDIPSSVVAFQGFLGAGLAGLGLMLVQTDAVQPMTTSQIGLCLCAVLFGTTGYYGIVQAMRLGDASAIMPFRYTRLVFSIIAGIMIFEERPDALTLLGASIIIATGIYTFFRERKLAQSSFAQG